MRRATRVFSILPPFRGPTERSSHHAAGAARPAGTLQHQQQSAGRSVGAEGKSGRAGEAAAAEAEWMPMSASAKNDAARRTCQPPSAFAPPFPLLSAFLPRMAEARVGAGGSGCVLAWRAMLLRKERERGGGSRRSEAAETVVAARPSSSPTAARKMFILPSLVRSGMHSDSALLSLRRAGVALWSRCTRSAELQHAHFDRGKNGHTHIIQADRSTVLRPGLWL